MLPLKPTAVGTCMNCVCLCVLYFFVTLQSVRSAPAGPHIYQTQSSQYIKILRIILHQFIKCSCRIVPDKRFLVSGIKLGATA